MTVTVDYAKAQSDGRFQQSGTGAVTRTAQEKMREAISVEDFDSGSGVVAQIHNALTAAGSGGEVLFRNSEYICDEPILAENLRGVRLLGKPGQYGFSGTRLVGTHTGKATLSLVGSLFCELDGIVVDGATAARPKTGLLLGRSSAASAGNHTFKNLRIQGYYSVAGLYNIASEVNTFVNCFILPEAAPIAGVFMCQGDTHTIGGLTGSSMEANTFIGGTIGSNDTTAGSTALYLDCGAATGHHQFLGTFLSKNGGDSFITIRLGDADSADTEFPISFYNVVGENGATAPTTGLHFVTAQTRILSGFTAVNLRFETPATNNILCDGGGTVYLVGAHITTPYRAAGTKPSTFHRLDSSTLELYSESAITIATLVGSSLQSIATPSISTNTRNLIRDLGGAVFALPQVTGNLTAAGTMAMDGKTAITVVAAPDAATDLATALTLANDMRTRLINFGIYA